MRNKDFMLHFEETNPAYAEVAQAGFASVAQPTSCDAGTSGSEAESVRPIDQSRPSTMKRSTGGDLNKQRFGYFEIPLLLGEEESTIYVVTTRFRTASTSAA